MPSMDDAIKEQKKSIDKRCQRIVDAGLTYGTITHKDLFILNGDTMYKLTDPHGAEILFSLTQNKVYSYGGNINSDYVTNDFFINNTTLDKVIMPPLLYKYREAEKPEHRTMTRDGSVFFAPPQTFTDPLDCKIPIRYDLLTDQEIYNKYYTEIKKQYPHKLKQFLDVRTRAEMRKELMRNNQHLEEVEKEYWKIMNERFGVLSLTENYTNLEMWMQYSANFNGFCMGINTGILFSKRGGGGGKVTYCETLPVIKPFEDALIQNYKQTFHKTNNWSFEDEYRTHKTWDHTATIEERSMPLPSSAFETIIIGENVKPTVQQQIIDEITKLNPNINIKTTKMSGNKIEIVPL